MQKVPLKKVKN